MNLTITVDAAEEPGWNVGLVTKYIPDITFENKENAAVIVVGPPVMMKFAVAEFKKLDIEYRQIWISQERKMCCGLANAATAGWETPISVWTARYLIIRKAKNCWIKEVGMMHVDVNTKKLKKNAFRVTKHRDIVASKSASPEGPVTQMY